MKIKLEQFGAMEGKGCFSNVFQSILQLEVSKILTGWVLNKRKISVSADHPLSTLLVGEDDLTENTCQLCTHP